MIEIPRTINPLVSTSAKTATKNVRFQAISDEDIAPIIEIERRRFTFQGVNLPLKSNKLNVGFLLIVAVVHLAARHKFIPDFI